MSETFVNNKAFFFEVEGRDVLDEDVVLVIRDDGTFYHHVWAQTAYGHSAKDVEG